MVSPACQTIAQAVRAQRVALRLTQDALARLAGVSRKTILALETETAPLPLWSTCERVWEILRLGVTIAPVTPPTLDDLLAHPYDEEAPPPRKSRVRPSRRAGGTHTDTDVSSTGQAVNEESEDEEGPRAS